MSQHDLMSKRELQPSNSVPDIRYQSSRLPWANMSGDSIFTFYPLTDTVKANTLTDSLDSQKPGTRRKIAVFSQRPDNNVENNVFSCILFFFGILLRFRVRSTEKNRIELQNIYDLKFAHITRVKQPHIFIQ